MTLYLLERKPDDSAAIYDANHGLVVRASGAQEARALAANNAKDEGPAVWLDPTQSVVREISGDGPSEIILVDFFAG